MSCLAHTRAGITDAMITVGAIKLLIQHLYSDNDQVHVASAIALGYLSFNRVGMRQLLTLCRDTPGLYQLLMRSKPMMNKDFLDEFRVCRIVGLPSLRWVRVCGNAGFIIGDLEVWLRGWILGSPNLHTTYLIYYS